MKLTHKGPAKQEVESTISFSENDVIDALQEFASKRGIQCPPALEYRLNVKTDRYGFNYESEDFVTLRTRRDGDMNPIYESVRSNGRTPQNKPEPIDPPRPLGGIHEVA